jgi:cell wall-associated NlpC family hydrolase
MAYKSLCNGPRWLLVFATAMLLTACGTMQLQTPVGENKQIRSTLYSQYEGWKHVRYRSGGLSKSGVDCSGFVYLTFRDEFGVNLPRSTHDQVRSGKTIAQRELVPGDLVFFKTGTRSRHGGIYLENRRFLHASTEKGIMISSLDDRYWSRAYWTSVRVLS